jgi:hypothetical protein
LASTFGVKVTGIPIGLRVGIQAADSENQRITSSRIVVLDVPESAFTDIIAQYDRQHASTGSGRSGRTPSADTSALERRLEELEKENVRLKAQNDVLTNLLRQKAGPGPTSRPAD